MVVGAHVIFLMLPITRSYGTIIQMIFCIFFLPTIRSAGTENVWLVFHFLPISFSTITQVEIMRCIIFYLPIFHPV
jgi:competence transcription factor ComK